MNEECKIVDEDAAPLSFRRFKPEELEKKYSPFERVQKKDFPFLFQKKQLPKDTKTSLDEIIGKMRDLSFNTPPCSPQFSPQFSPIYKPISENPFPNLLPLTPLSIRGLSYRRTPPPPDEIVDIPELDLNCDLSANEVEMKDGPTNK